MASFDPLLVFVVMRLAERLPVVLVPEQRLVSTVGADVVDNRGGSDPPFPLTHDTERMLAEKPEPGAFPPAIVTTLAGRQTPVIWLVEISRHRKLWQKLGIKKGGHFWSPHNSAASICDDYSALIP